MRHARWLVAGGALAAAAGGGEVAEAQVVSIVDAGTGTVQVAHERISTAATLSPSIRREGPNSLLAATGTLSLLESGRTASQGEIAGSFFTTGRGLVRAELAGGATGALHTNRVRTGEYHGRARLHFLGGERGLWLGGGGGRAWNSDHWLTSLAADAGAWARIGALTMSASVTSTAVRGGEALLLPTGPDGLAPADGGVVPGGPGGAVAPMRTFHDALGAVRWTRGPLELDLFAGTRGDGSLAAVESWGGASGAWWLGDNLAVVASAGGYPADLEQGLPNGRYATIGIRLASRQPLSPRVAPVVARPRASTFLVMPAGDSARVVRMRVPGARKVELMGDFSDWQPIALRRVSADEWEARLPLRAGAYRLNVRIDDGVWDVPPGVTAITDEFSGVVGVLIIQ